LRDIKLLRKSKLDDGVIKFSKATAKVKTAA
jgi:hypothetical protein